VLGRRVGRESCREIVAMPVFVLIGRPRFTGLMKEPKCFSERVY